MPRVTFIAFDGTPHVVDVPAGTTLMRAATDHGVPGIDGDCGGNCACATCHIYVEAPWSARTGERTAVENDMLNFSAGLRDTSRLACQITMSDALDGIEVHMPQGQH
jgi:2Fe-2S ferredoxin